MKIYDCHSHLYDSNSSTENFFFEDEPDGPLPPERFAEHALAEPVDRMFISANPDWLATPEGLADANDRVAALVKSCPSRFSGLCQVNAHLPAESLEQIDRHVANGSLVGIGEICQYILKHETDDPRIFEIIERAVSLDVPILQHASSREHTEGVDRLAAAFPKARFIMAHMGGMYNWPHGVEVARKHDNVWVDSSGFVMLCLGAFHRAVSTLGPGKILFGVDFPLITAGPLVAMLEKTCLHRKDLERIAWKNAAELFHLDAPA